MKISNVLKIKYLDLFFDQNFTKGDHLFRGTKIVAQLENNTRIELSQYKIREYYNGTRISNKHLDGLIGQDHRKFVK